jgi:hypothetical protein
MSFMSMTDLIKETTLHAGMQEEHTAQVDILNQVNAEQAGVIEELSQQVEALQHRAAGSPGDRQEGQISVHWLDELRAAKDRALELEQQMEALKVLRPVSVLHYAAFAMGCRLAFGSISICTHNLML